MPALIVAGTTAAIQAGIGVAQYAKGVKDLKNLTRPEYHIPPEIEKNMTEADLMAYYGMPDAQKAEYQQNIQRTQQAATRGIADRKGGIGSIVAAQQQTQDAYTKMLSMDVQQRMANIQRAQQMRQTMAQYRDKAWQINEMDPYEQSYAEAQSMMGAGMQNFMGGLQAAGSMAMTKYGIDNAPQPPAPTFSTAPQVAPSFNFNIPSSNPFTQNNQTAFGQGIAQGNVANQWEQGQNPLQGGMPFSSNYTFPWQ